MGPKYLYRAIYSAQTAAQVYLGEQPSGLMGLTSHPLAQQAHTPPPSIHPCPFPVYKLGHLHPQAPQTLASTRAFERHSWAYSRHTEASEPGSHLLTYWVPLARHPTVH